MEFIKVCDVIRWRVDMNFTPISSPLRPSNHMQSFAPTLPKQYSPINASGHGYQHVYLASIPRAMALMLGQLISPELLRIVRDTRAAEEPAVVDTELRGISEWEEAETKRILEAKTLSETTRKALIKARVGQGLFRRNLAQFENHCRITGVTYQGHLFASHIKPWRESSNEERLNGENGLLLTPSIDHLFDRGFISFEDNGELIISDVTHKESIRRMGVHTDNILHVCRFSNGQK